MNKQQKQVVIVDDDEDLLRLLLAAFHAQGIKAIGLSTGKEAQKFLSKAENLKGVSLLILDRMLPDMDGIEILKQYRKNLGQRVPVLILSMLTAEKDVLQGLKLGAIDYIGKPFSLPILMEKALVLIGV